MDEQTCAHELPQRQGKQQQPSHRHEARFADITMSYANTERVTREAKAMDDIGRQRYSAIPRLLPLVGTLRYLYSRYRIQQGAASSSYILDQTSRTTIAPPPDTGDPGRRELYEHSVQLH
ncbi:hypothetical protein TRIATDRAFT_93282 [Trichoderma atroviride IMI 206040]|uniref:Uncharacterized protein n=1 Tax=Hypocrea atroviridis (strain ATCC 20476 / IMI 206040) TaxID=452589 RepID=G9NPD2_HYPAI|nr:uncharacterized protein TRIATDRAFT_93282 [Trichoderma atroviride IMI 206040]EHK47403.1 hypothetical protein TRIATDRAFT_93282 [Trichoderma atroviride IMI 206040]